MTSLSAVVYGLPVPKSKFYTGEAPSGWQVWWATWLQVASNKGINKRIDKGHGLAKLANFPDDQNETKKKQIAKFSYS
jgi:hypothetical protein